MAILAVFSVLFFVGAAMALVGVAGTMDLLSGKSVVLARLIPPLRLLEQKKVRRTQQARAQRAGVIKMALLASFVLMALAGVGLAITEMQRKESPYGMLEPPAEMKQEHETVVNFLDMLAAGRLQDAARRCESPPLVLAEGGIRDQNTDVTLRSDKVEPIDTMQLQPDGKIAVRLLNGYRLTWTYRPGRRPHDGRKEPDPIQLARIDPPPKAETQPLLPPLPPLPELPAVPPETMPAMPRT